MKPPQELTNEELAAQPSAEEILRGLDYVMDWKNQKPDAVKFACSIADARQWIIDARAEIASLRANPAPIAPSNVALIEQMTNAFLIWPLPESVCADLCATKQGPNRIATNLLSFTEAREMIQELVLPYLAACKSEAESAIPTGDWAEAAAKDADKFVADWCLLGNTRKDYVVGLLMEIMRRHAGAAGYGHQSQVNAQVADNWRNEAARLGEELTDALAAEAAAQAECERQIMQVNENFVKMTDQRNALATELAAARERCAAGETMLEKCFWYLGRQIEAKPLHESGTDGTQELSREIAKLLDAAKAALAAGKGV